MVTATMIRKVRLDAEMTQDELAGVLGVSRQAVQKWESGASIPDIENITNIAKHFDVSIDSLVLGSDTRLTEEL
ncbi:MAG: helix-turn-helix transcriptional regulator, partial [Clostridia bacterium]|nr:helix-turn-helix transcriptional regulator [Clostridia bacterium]